MPSPVFAAAWVASLSKGGLIAVSSDQAAGARDRLSVIIPALGPSRELSFLLASLDAGLGSRDEVVVVLASGEPRDGFDIGGARHPVRVIFSPQGRGIQLNRGVGASRGELLWFLHVDSRLASGFAAAIRQVCSDSRVSLGCFCLAFHPSSPMLDCIARWARARTRWLGMPYGDQGLFCRRAIWEKAGGFRKPCLMEDVDFVRACRKLGRIQMLDQRIYTSPRRYLDRGIWRASLQNHVTLLRYHLGEDDRKLYARYYGRENTPPGNGLWPCP